MKSVANFNKRSLGCGSSNTSCGGGGQITIKSTSVSIKIQEELHRQLSLYYFLIFFIEREGKRIRKTKKIFFCKLYFLI
jgi:hypothetical protein